MVGLRRLFFLVFLTLGLASLSKAQTLREFQSILARNPIQGKAQPTFQLEPSEFKTLALGSIRLYQIFIATQDMSVCNFTPSCSHFAEQAFQNLSPFRALLLASDRLLRDNPSVAGHYSVDAQTGRFADPLNFYMKLLKIGAKGKSGRAKARK